MKTKTEATHTPTPWHGYDAWEVFRFRGIKFLAVMTGMQEVVIFNRAFNNYGSYYSVENFKKFYEKDGEKLNCSIAQAEARICSHHGPGHEFGSSACEKQKEIDEAEART